MVVSFVISACLFSDNNPYNTIMFEGAGPAGMGNASMTFMNDNNAILYNPACLADITGRITSFECNVLKYNQDEYYSGDISDVQGQISAVDNGFGVFMGSGISNVGGDINDNAVLIILARGFQINDRISVGASFKIGGPFNTNDTAGLGLDIACVIKAADFLQIGIVWTNPVLFGNTLQASQSFPQLFDNSDINAGFGIKLPTDTLIQFEAVDIFRQYTASLFNESGSATFHYNNREFELGLRQKIGDNFRIRCGIDYGGYYYFTAGSFFGEAVRFSNFTALTFGLGYDMRNYSMDAFVSSGINSGASYPASERLGTGIKYYY